MTVASDRDYRRDFYRAVEQRQATDARQGQFYVPIYDHPMLKPHDVVSTLKDGIALGLRRDVLNNQGRGEGRHAVRGGPASIARRAASGHRAGTCAGCWARTWIGCWPIPAA